MNSKKRAKNCRSGWKRIGKNLPVSRNKMATRRMSRVLTSVVGFPRNLSVLVVLLSLGVCLLMLRRSTAQETPGDQPSAGAVQKQERTTDNATLNATLNLHRWGAVTLFHGLPSDRVNAITEDSNGAMWFATDNGLVRYDGRNVEAVPNESALPSRRILSLKFDARGTLWIGTEAGAARLRNHKIEIFPETP